MTTSTTRQPAVRYENQDGIGVITLDDPQQRANTMNAAYVADMGAVVEQVLADRADLRGVVVTSAKQTFFAGGDMPSMIKATPADAPVIFAQIEEVKRQLRALETLGVPVVAALNGTALGGGLEIALACHHRVAVDDGRSEFGLPEVTLGLLPGGGGVTRVTRMLGLQAALTTVLLQGPRMKPTRAKDAGLLDELVPSLDDLLPAAKAWIDAHALDPEAATQPWDRPGYKMPGGTPSTPKLAQFLPAFPATLRKQLKGAAYPAPRAILSAAVEGAQVDFETATRIESRYLVSLMTGQTFKNMTQAFFFDMQQVNGGGSRPVDVPQRTVRRLAVLGAGMMGAGVAYVSAKAGIEVVLKDVSAQAAQRGKAHAEKLLSAQVDQGRLTAEKREEVLARITATDQAADVAGCDMVVEAVFESLDLKHRVFAEVEPLLAPDALLGSNTSTLPITELATGVSRQEDFIGVHFFSPVDKMALVEIIVGEKTSDEAIARAYDYARQIAKTPIVVNDSRGFFTSRVFGTLLMEAVRLVAEGVNPVTIERAASQGGFPAPPLAMLDEVSLTLTQHIEASAKAAAQASGAPYEPPPGMALIDRMVEEFGRPGKAAGAGFYDYPAEGPKRLWPGLWDQLGCARDGVGRVPVRDICDRLTFSMSQETIRCLAEGVLRSVPDANIGSIFGIGFPANGGGAIQFANGYEGGLAGFVARSRELAAAYGERFEPPALAVEKAEAGEPLA